MTSYYKSPDLTTNDNSRRELSFRRADIKNVVPEHFLEEYPKLINLFEKYYEWLDDSDNPGNLINDLYLSRDITQVKDRFLQYIEDEYLLGQSYFEGFQNKREAAKYSNTLYRSKGTFYSIQQFFRAFFGTDPIVTYTKDRVFKVGPVINQEAVPINTSGEQVLQGGGIIGSESQKYITDDKLYQTLAILIRSEIPIQEWIELYKLFVHPAGMYVGGEVLIETQNITGLKTIQTKVRDPISTAKSFTTNAAFDVAAYTSVTRLRDSDNSEYRQRIATLFDYQTATLQDLQGFNSIQHFLTASAPTLDMDTSGNGTFTGIRMDDSDTLTIRFDLDVFDSAGTIY
jgi:hypothetical protein